MTVTSQVLAAAQAAVTISTDIVNISAAGVPVGAVGVQISGTFTATLLPEASVDGANWFAVNMYPIMAAGILGAGVPSAAAGGQWFIPVWGFNAVRVRCSAFTSGQATVALEIAGGSGLSNSFVELEGQKQTFSYANLTYTPYATPLAINQLSWVSKIVRLRKVWLTAFATAAGQQGFSILKQSTANSGGTPAAKTAVPHDSANVAATATIAEYSAGTVTPGTPVGTNGAVAADIIGYGAGAPNIRYEWNFPAWGAQSVVLRAASQTINLSLDGGALPSGGKLAYGYTWTEE